MFTRSESNSKRREREKLAAAAGTSRQPLKPEEREKETAESGSVRPGGGELPDRLGVDEVILIRERVGDLQGVQYG